MPGRFGIEYAREQVRQGYNGNGPVPYNPQLQYDQSGYNGPPPVQYNNQYGYNGPPRPPAGKFDGPMDNSGRPTGPGGFGPSLGYDPARMGRPDERPRVITNTRVELPAMAYRLEGQTVSTLFYFLRELFLRGDGALVVLFTPPLLQASKALPRSLSKSNLNSSELASQLGSYDLHSATIHPPFPTFVRHLRQLPPSSFPLLAQNTSDIGVFPSAPFSHFPIKGGLFSHNLQASPSHNTTSSPRLQVNNNILPIHISTINQTSSSLAQTKHLKPIKTVDSSTFKCA
jgi:hypothetical protein